MMNIKDALKITADKEPIQSINKAKAEKEVTDKHIEKSNAFIGKGRPKVSDYQKRKARSIAFSDEEMDKITKVAELNGMKPNAYIQFCVFKELRREGV